MKKHWIIISVSILIILILCFFFIIYPLIAKKTIYKKDVAYTKYPGSGKNIEHIDKYLIVTPHGKGKTFFIPYGNKNSYPNSEYDVIEIEEQDKISYAVGKFEGWEDIKNSLDKYILVKYEDITEKWRVSFSGLPVSSNEATKLGIEDISLLNFDPNGKNIITKPNPFLISDIGFQKLRNLIKKGDTVILLPVYAEPILNKRDENNELMAGWIIIRRGEFTNN